MCIRDSNTSGLPADISGWTYADYPTGSATPNHSLTFPPGTVIPPNGYIVIGLATGTSDPVNYYYAATGTSGQYGSGSNAGFILRNGGGTIIDAVLTNTGTFNALKVPVFVRTASMIVPPPLRRMKPALEPEPYCPEVPVAA